MNSTYVFLFESFTYYGYQGHVIYIMCPPLFAELEVQKHEGTFQLAETCSLMLEIMNARSYVKLNKWKTFQNYQELHEGGKVGVYFSTIMSNGQGHQLRNKYLISLYHILNFIHILDLP